MRMVELTKDMRPWRAGDKVPLADDLADRLVADKEATEAGPFPPAGIGPETTAAPPAPHARRLGRFRTKA